jgi:hypothetical protein
VSRRSPNRNLNLEEGSDLRKGFPTRFDENMTILDDHAHVVADLTDPENLPGGASSLVHNVADFDAAGDGVTNDTDGIQAAYDAAATDGGIVFYPPGVFMVDADAASFASKVSTVGSGIGATFLRRRTGGTGSVLQSHLAGTSGNTTYGFTIRDITIDGNYGVDGAEAFGGTGGNGLYIQGDSYTLDNFRIINCKDYGFYGYSTVSISNGPGSETPPIGGQTRITNFAIHNAYSTDAAFSWNGPSDSFIDRFVIEMNDVANPPNHKAMKIAAGAGGNKISNFHLWSDRCALTQLSLESGNNLVTNATIESSAPNGQLVLLLADSNVITNADLYDNTPDHTLHKGIVWGDGTHTVNDCYIRAQIANCYAGALDVTHAGTGNNVDVYVVTPATTATITVGTFGANNRFSYSKYDSGGYAKSAAANVLSGVTVSGTPSSDQVLTATSGTAATWQGLPYRVMSGVTVQAWGDTPIDQSSAVQANIDALHNAGGGVLLLHAYGVVYGSFKMRPKVSLRGAGFGTVLRAMPSQTAAVLDYATYDAYHTTIEKLRVNGHYTNGGTGNATCRGINMASSNNDAFSLPFPQAGPPYEQDFPPPNFGAWDNPNNRIVDVQVSDIGGDVGVYIGVNQRNCRTRGLTIEFCKAIGLQIRSTDSQHSDTDVGVCGDCILMTGAANKIVGFKAWYAGRVTGYTTGSGDGIRISSEFSPYGEVLAIGETQDNNRYGWAITNGHSHHCQGLSGGDLGSCVYIGSDGNGSASVQYNRLKITHGKSDISTQTNAGVTIDNGATWNTIDLSVEPGFLGASWAAIKFLNSGTLNTNDVRVVHGQDGGYYSQGTVTGTVTPFVASAETQYFTINSAVTIGAATNLGWRRRVKFVINAQASAVVSWHSSWNGAPSITANTLTEVEFINVADTTNTASWQYLKRV